MTDILDTLRAPLALPCGATLPNRLSKAAMTEGLANADGEPDGRLATLYARWAKGGAGMLLTGNVLVDRHHLERPGNVVLDRPPSAAAKAGLKAWASAAADNGAHLWMQINHAGRQTSKAVNPSPKSASAVGLALPGDRFGQPVPLTGAEILDLVDRFANAAAAAREAGFHGVQIHAAHGYLMSQFLSPRVNQRQDEWGGDLAGRARFLLAVVEKTRSLVGAGFPVSVKLNSADFQRGGFSFEDSHTVAGWLDAAGVDLIEISGGTYEQPKMMNLEGMEPSFDPTTSASTRARESYFARFAPEMRRHVKRAALMVTGGFRTATGMAAAVTEDGVDVIGVARPLCVDPDQVRKLLAGEISELDRWEDRLRLGPGLLGPASPIKLIKAINGFGAQSWYYEQIVRLGDGRNGDARLGFAKAMGDAGKREKAVLAAFRAKGG